MPAFYNQPQTIDDLINHSVGRVLDLFDIDAGAVKRWEGATALAAKAPLNVSDLTERKQ
jgi:3-polyprenyl-4-hydroxybenzoate decarboxylase